MVHRVLGVWLVLAEMCQNGGRGGDSAAPARAPRAPPWPKGSPRASWGALVAGAGAGCGGPPRRPGVAGNAPARRQLLPYKATRRGAGAARCRPLPPLRGKPRAGGTCLLAEALQDAVDGQAGGLEMDSTDLRGGSRGRSGGLGRGGGSMHAATGPAARCCMPCHRTGWCSRLRWSRAGRGRAEVRGGQQPGSGGRTPGGLPTAPAGYPRYAAASQDRSLQPHSRDTSAGRGGPTAGKPCDIFGGKLRLCDAVGSSRSWRS